MLIAFFLMAGLLIVLSWRAGRTARHSDDYFLAGRQLPTGQIALSQASNALPVWLLVGVAGAAFTWGFAAVWIVLTALVGHALAWFFVGPRLRTWSAERNRVTFTQFLTADAGERMRAPVVLSTTLILFLGILIGMAAYLPWLGQLLASVAPISPRAAMLAGITGAGLSALLGGYRGACGNDSLRALAILLIALTVAVGGLIAAGGWSAVWVKLADVPVDVDLWTGEQVAILSLTFALGMLTLSLAPLGQHQVVSRFMACADHRQLVNTRRTALLWTLLVLASMLLCGWTARLLLPETTPPDALFLELVGRVLPAGLATVFIAALFVSAFSALENILLVMAAAVSVDVKNNPVRGSLDWPKPAVVLAAGLLAAVALEVPEPTFERLLLAWTLLGSAFGPLLFVRLTGKRVRPGSMLGSMWAGFVLTLLLHMLPSAPGDFLERALPFVAALGIALTGGDRRRNPDRADRTQEAAPEKSP